MASSEHLHFMLTVYSACITSSTKQIPQWIVKLYPDKWKAQYSGYQWNILLDCTQHSLQSSIIACWAFPILSIGKWVLTSIVSGIFVTHSQPLPVYCKTGRPHWKYLQDGHRHTSSNFSYLVEGRCKHFWRSKTQKKPHFITIASQFCKYRDELT